MKQISIHALRKESDTRKVDCVVYAWISIHALRKESDNWAFNDASSHVISIHALRKESDRINDGRHANPIHFNPRSP